MAILSRQLKASMLIYLDALRDSEGEEYFMTHLAVADLLPAGIEPIGVVSH